MYMYINSSEKTNLAYHNKKKVRRQKQNGIKVKALRKKENYMKVSDRASMREMMSDETLLMAKMRVSRWTLVLFQRNPTLLYTPPPTPQTPSLWRLSNTFKQMSGKVLVTAQPLFLLARCQWEACIALLLLLISWGKTHLGNYHMNFCGNVDNFKHRFQDSFVFPDALHATPSLHVSFFWRIQAGEKQEEHNI